MLSVNIQVKIAALFVPQARNDVIARRYDEAIFFKIFIFDLTLKCYLLSQKTNSKIT